MPPLLLDDDEAIAIAVGLAHRRPRVRHRDRGDRPFERSSSSSRSCRLTFAVASGRSARRPSRLPVGGPTVDPQHLTVIAAACRDTRVPSLRLQEPRRHRQPPRGRAALARQPRSPLVPRRLGPPPRGLAHLPRRSARPPGVDAASGSRHARCLPRDAAAYVEQSITGGATPLRGHGHAPRRRPTRSPPASPRTGARSRRTTRTAACSGPATTTSDWLALRIAMLGVDFDGPRAARAGRRTCVRSPAG